MDGFVAYHYKWLVISHQNKGLTIEVSMVPLDTVDNSQHLPFYIPVPGLVFS